MLIGLTGGIASGKSLVAEELKRLGVHLIDADEIAREVVKTGLPAYNEIVKEFGEKILNPDKTINRKELGRIVFSNTELRRRLERITHPRKQEKIAKYIKEKKGRQPYYIFLFFPLKFYMKKSAYLLFSVKGIWAEMRFFASFMVKPSLSVKRFICVFSSA